MGHKLHEYEWDAELDMGDVFDDIKEDKVKYQCASPVRGCNYESFGACTYGADDWEAHDCPWVMIPKEDKVSIHAVCAASDCMYEKDGLCTLNVLCPFQSTLKEDKNMERNDYTRPKTTTTTSMLQHWLNRIPNNLPVYVEIDGCRVEATGILITANEIVLISDESGEYV